MFKKLCLITIGLGLITALPVVAQELAIPRFVSFRRSEVNLRTGPGNRYPIKYVYYVQNYPVEVIDEYELWRQIREVDGTVGWVHRRLLSGVRYIITTKNGVLYKKPDNTSATVAYVQKGSLAKLEECPPHSDFCEVLFVFNDKKYQGWLEKSSFYGVYPHEVVQ